MRKYVIVKDHQTSIWALFSNAIPKAYSGSPDGGNVQALVDLIPKDEKLELEVIS